MVHCVMHKERISHNIYAFLIHSAERNVNISMLVTSNSSKFLKKATGRITFSCDQGFDVKKVFDELDKENSTSKILLFSKGIDEAGDIVSEFEFEWSLKRRF